MHVIGVTGGVGMGKSTTARMLAQRGLAVCDSDVLAREAVAPGQPALQEIARQFGAEVIRSDGSLDRAQMARVVFTNPVHRRQLEAILHPRIRARWQQQLADWAEEGRAEAVVVIPLLYETQAESLFHSVICAACSAATQRLRLHDRGWNTEAIEQRIAAQWPVEKKIRLAHYVVWTETNMDLHETQVNRILEEIRGQVTCQGK